MENFILRFGSLQLRPSPKPLPSRHHSSLGQCILTFCKNCCGEETINPVCSINIVYLFFSDVNILEYCMSGSRIVDDWSIKQDSEWRFQFSEQHILCNCMYVQRYHCAVITNTVFTRDYASTCRFLLEVYQGIPVYHLKYVVNGSAKGGWQLDWTILINL
jgi:hypothetical protein